ncbi:MAG: NgoFVII family restriction endonuclease [Bacteroidetes bacterium]|nr:NgoFVII family restriction endonuclease [Bacteroidota bacterium]
MSLQIISNSLSEEILTSPIRRREADSLHILSGFASSNAASRHLRSLSEISDNFNLQLTIGMARNGAITQNSHLAFRRLTQEFYCTKFSCNYMPVTSPIHSKIYVWLREQTPVRAWICSANYTQAALYTFRQQEVASSCNPNQALEIVQQAYNSGVSCTSDSAQACVADRVPSIAGNVIQRGDLVLETVSWSLLSDTREDGLRYGINWGHRGTRNRNEAYIPIPSQVYNTSFFPDRPINFTVRTDDGFVFTCVREQDNGKAITTPINNSDIGLWLRRRIGLNSGDLITSDNLQSANVAIVSFSKISEDEYLLEMKGE